MGIWAAPITIESATNLYNLMSNPISANHSMDVLGDLVGDDTLYDFLVKAKEINGNVDVRPLIAYTIFEYNHLKPESEWLSGRENGVREILDTIIDSHFPLKNQGNELISYFTKIKEPEDAIKEVAKAMDMKVENLNIIDTNYDGVFTVKDNDYNVYHLDAMNILVYEITPELLEHYEGRVLVAAPAPI